MAQEEQPLITGEDFDEVIARSRERLVWESEGLPSYELRRRLRDHEALVVVAAGLRPKHNHVSSGVYGGCPACGTMPKGEPA